MMRAHRFASVAAILMLAMGSAQAQEDPADIAPPPMAAPDDQQRITPIEQHADDAAMMTTHPVARDADDGGKKLPWQKPVPAGDVAPPPQPVPFAPAPAANTPAMAPGSYQPKIPFGHADPVPASIPSGPHSTEAVPVGDVDAVEASEPQPATPVAPAADPVKDDPAAPTELTSPIFDAGTDEAAPRKIIIRALNKVTAQSELMEIKPGDTIKFGRLEITAVTCRASSPTSQTDYAGLLDISEHLPDKKDGMKPLFRGWMYASSPSIAALEHPVYDVTMVECKLAVAAPKAAEKPSKPAAKKAKK